MKTDKPENPQAFPINSSNALDEIQHYGKGGMTLRDYFAAKLFNDIARLDFDNYKLLHSSNCDTESIASRCAKYAYQLADAMLKERNK